MKLVEFVRSHDMGPITINPNMVSTIAPLKNTNPVRTQVKLTAGQFETNEPYADVVKKINAAGQ